LNTPLTAALKQRDDIVEHLKPIDARIRKLEALVQSSSPAVSEKSALHSDHAQRLKTWVANADDNELPPSLDADRLQRLDAEIGAHESSKASASEGLRALIAARSKLVDEHKAAVAAAQFAATEHVINEALPEMIDSFNSAHKVLVDAKDRIDGAYQFLMSEGARLSNTSFNARAERLWSEVTAKKIQPVSHVDFTPLRDRINELLAPANAKEVA
jgi:chromosome segregation ATPase